MALASEQTRDVESNAKISISYSRKDMAFADRLAAALKARGFEVLIDREEIYAFEDWWKRIEALLGGALYRQGCNLGVLAVKFKSDTLHVRIIWHVTHLQMADHWGRGRFHCRRGHPFLLD
jgi:hypothetical protein